MMMFVSIRYTLAPVPFFPQFFLKRNSVYGGFFQYSGSLYKRVVRYFSSSDGGYIEENMFLFADCNAWVRYEPAAFFYYRFNSHIISLFPIYHDEVLMI